MADGCTRLPIRAIQSHLLQPLCDITCLTWQREERHIRRILPVRWRRANVESTASTGIAGSHVPTNPDVLYYGGNVLFKTTDRGETWQALSPDLTTNDPEKLKPSGGPISSDNTRAEFHCTLISIAESPRDARVVWAGTDDGHVQLTRDGGKTWTNVVGAIAGAPKFSCVSSIAASAVDAGTAYLTIDQHRLTISRPTSSSPTTTAARGAQSRRAGGLRAWSPKIRNSRISGIAGTGSGSLFPDRGVVTDQVSLPPLLSSIRVHPRDNGRHRHARAGFTSSTMRHHPGARDPVPRATLFAPCPPFASPPATRAHSAIASGGAHQPLRALRTMPQARSDVRLTADSSGTVAEHGGTRRGGRQSRGLEPE